ncbi:hypothetical protein ACIPWF_21170 [Paenarthrobacter sp. NPDC089989]|uniref:hypothetical protein n=1 Tax=unclassified Paenarthrobacter TaxID=2634190 RepID=UPI00380EB7BE
MRGRNWLVRRTEARLGNDLGGLRFVAASRRIFWKVLPFCLVVGFVFGTIGEFVSPIRSTREAGHFSDPLLFATTSILTGLVLWAMTFLGSFRKLLVFEGGLVAKYSQRHTTVVLRWEDAATESFKAVTTSDGTDPDRRLLASRKVSLGAGGRNAVVFKAQESFWAFPVTRTRRRWSTPSARPCQGLEYPVRPVGRKVRCPPSCFPDARHWTEKYGNQALAEPLPAGSM